MKFFWPNRSKAKGFSNEKLASKDPEKISILSSNEISNQLIADKNLKAKIEDNNHLAISDLSVKRGHWANRDFSEYKEVA